MPMLHDHRICGCSHAHAHSDFASKDAPANYPPDLRLEPVHTEINLFVDLDQQRAEGHVTHTVAVHQQGVAALILDAIDLDIAGIEDEDGSALAFQYDNKKLSISWPASAAAGTQRRVTIRYAVNQPISGLFFSKPTAALPRSPWFAATDHETERARHWLPCIDLPNVRVRLDFHLRAHERFTILANGAKQSEQAHGDGTKTIHWRLDWPCPSYITCFAIGEFTQALDGEFEGLPVAYYAAAHHSEADLMRSFGRTRDMLDWMTKRLGHAFPFPKYFQFALPDFGGAMENISLVSWDDVFVMDEKLALEWTWLVDQVNVHEMAHSYFGDAVVCRDFSHAWLKESWATYMEQCWLEHRYGDDEMHYDFWRNQQAYFSEADGSYKRPIVTRRFDSSWQMYDRHLYPGGGARLHMLRKHLGDDTFWAGIKDYLGEFMGKTVETEDFRKILERRSGRSLVQFFEQWFYTAAYPALKVSFAWDEATKRGTFTVEQTQAADDKEPVFIIDSEVGWRADGQDHTAPILLQSAKTMLTVDMPTKPDFVRFDALNRTVAKLDLSGIDEPLLLAQLTGARDIIGRIQAAHALAATGKRAHIKALVEAHAAEQFWGVRQEIAQALAKNGVEAALEAVVTLIGREQDPLALEATLRAGAAWRDVRITDAVAARLAAGDLPYRAQEAAYAALGAQRAAAPWDTLIEGADHEQFAAFAQAGALRALAATRKREAIDPLIARSLPDHAPTIARAAALTALGGLARVVDRADRTRIIEHLVDRLRDPERRASAAAAQGLFAAKAGEADGALRAWRTTLPHQETPGIDRQLAALHMSDDGAAKALEGKVEELTGKLRAMADRLEKLEHLQKSAEEKA
jgi:aminopeptidase N